MVYTEYTFRNVFQYEEGDVYWCTADVGWITGHSYIIYGPLLAGATTMMFEGVPTYPDAGRFWDVIQRHKVNIFYTAPTAIRALMAAGNEWVEKQDVSEIADQKNGFKGGVSDALKRAAVKWGIGRYLYEYEPAWVTLDNGRLPKTIALPDEFLLDEEKR